MKLPYGFYDTLELMALANGGIGAGKDFDFLNSTSEGAERSCFCAHGPFAKLYINIVTGKIESHDDFETGTKNRYDSNDWWASICSIDNQLSKYITRWTNDNTVMSINIRKGTPNRSRVSFEEYCKALKIKRDETTEFGFSTKIPVYEEISNDKY